MGVLRGLVEWLTGEDRPAYECQGCGAGFARRRQVCPECGGYHIDRTDWKDPSSRH